MEENIEYKSLPSVISYVDGHSKDIRLCVEILTLGKLGMIQRAQLSRVMDKVRLILETLRDPARKENWGS